MTWRWSNCEISFNGSLRRTAFELFAQGNTPKWRIWHHLFILYAGVFFCETHTQIKRQTKLSHHSSTNRNKNLLHVGISIYCMFSPKVTFQAMWLFIWQWTFTGRPLYTIENITWPKKKKNQSIYACSTIMMSTMASEQKSKKQNWKWKHQLTRKRWKRKGPTCLWVKLLLIRIVHFPKSCCTNSYEIAKTCVFLWDCDGETHVLKKGNAAAFHSTAVKSEHIC